MHPTEMSYARMIYRQSGVDNKEVSDSAQRLQIEVDVDTQTELFYYLVSMGHVATNFWRAYRDFQGRTRKVVLSYSTSSKGEMARWGEAMHAWEQSAANALAAFS